MNSLRHLVGNRRGSSAAEFALTLPLLMILIFVIIDGGRYLWAINRLEKAAHWGTRFAVVTRPVTDGLTSADYVGTVVGGITLGQGDVIPAPAFGEVNCTSTGCCVAPVTCTAPYPALGTFQSGAFTNIVNRMKLIAPDISASNVTITYRGSGLGYAGDPSGMQIAPLVSVKVSGLTWTPLTSFTLKNASYPVISSTLSAEDSIGNSSF